MNNPESITFYQALLHQLGYDSFESLNSALNKENRRASNSLWGKLCISMYGVNRERKRTLLYTNWMKNRGQIKDLVAAEMPSKGELNKSDDKVVYQGNAYLDRSGKISKSGDNDSCKVIEISTMR